MREKNGVRTIALTAWLVASMGYFFQVPIGFFSSLIVPFLGLYLVLTIGVHRTLFEDVLWFKLFLVYILYLCVMSIVSLFGNAKADAVLRFFLILSVIPLCCAAKEPQFQQEYRIFLTIAVLKSLFLITIAAILLITRSFAGFRNWAWMNHFGDIYINPHDGLPRVQIHGNGILPFVFIVNTSFRKNSKHNTLISIILLAGIAAAGNLAYLLAIAMYYFLRMISYLFTKRKATIRKLVLTFVLGIAVLAFFVYTMQQATYKAEGSNDVRMEQARLLISNSNYLLGRGLGNRVFYSGIRTYEGKVYYELQTLYVLNQIGIVGLVYFYLLVLYKIRREGAKAMLFFLIYLFYTFWNPYCFDSTEMFAILLTVNVSAYQNDNVLSEGRWITG